MSLEMCQTDKDIRIHHCTSDLGCFDIFTTFYRYINIIRAFKTIRNNDRTSYRQRCKTILPCTFHMFKGILSAARIHRITICQKRLATQRFYQISHCPGIIRAKEAQIAQFTKMHFNGYELTVHIQLLNACFFQQFLQFCC